MSSLKGTIRHLLSVRAAPLLVGYGVFPAAREVIALDVLRWQEVKRRDDRGLTALLMLLTDTTHEFRNLYYHRLARQGLAGLVFSRLAALIYHGEPTLFLRTADIGPGLFIQHGFATSIGASRVGANCWVNQQVTIGFDSFLNAPVLEDEVVVSAGAIVIGGVTLGRGCHVGAGAVVTKDVPAGMVAVGTAATNREPGRNAKAHGPGSPDPA